MLVSEGMTLMNYVYRGSDDDVPATGTVDYNLWLAMMNVKKSEFAKDSKNTWSSLFNPVAPNEVGTVATTGTTTLTGTGTYFTDYQVGDKIIVSGETERTIDAITSDTVLTVSVAFTNTASAKNFTRQIIVKTGVRSYNLHRRFISLSDKIIINSTQDSELIIVKAKERTEDGCEVYVSSMNPQILTLVDNPNTEMIGGVIEVPGQYEPADMTSATDVINVDDPYWVAYAAASELARNDLTYEDKYPDLNGIANDLYSKMVTKNRRGTFNNPRTAKVNVYKILDPSGEGY
jgi:hypothetical protein